MSLSSGRDASTDGARAERVRAVFDALRHELLGASPAMFAPPSCRACAAAGAKGGRRVSAGRSRGGFTTSPRKIGRLRGYHRLRPDRRRSLRRRHFETLLDIGPDIQPRAVICDQGYASKANRDAARARGIAPVLPHKATIEHAWLLRTHPLQGPRPHRAGRRKALALQTRSAPMPKRPNETSYQSSAYAAGLCLIKFVHTA